MSNEINECWECFLCSKEETFEILPTAYLSNSHPLCKKCADTILKDENHKQRFRLSYHNSIGDLKMISNIPVQEGYLKLN